jgi:hypothetical protein
MFLFCFETQYHAVLQTVNSILLWTVRQLKIIFFPIAEGGAKMFGVFRVKNHDFTPKNHIFSNCGGRRENVWGISQNTPNIFAPPSAIGKNMIFGRKIVIFHTKPPTIFPPPSVRRKFFKCAPPP